MYCSHAGTDKPSQAVIKLWLQDRRAEAAAWTTPNIHTHNMFLAGLTVRSSPANFCREAGPQRGSSSPRRAGASSCLASLLLSSYSRVVALPCQWCMRA